MMDTQANKSSPFGLGNQINQRIFFFFSECRIGQNKDKGEVKRNASLQVMRRQGVEGFWEDAGCTDLGAAPLRVHRAVAVAKEKQVSSWREAVCSFLPRAEFCSSHLRVLIWSCKHNYHNTRGKKAWRKVNHASLSSSRACSTPQLSPGTPLRTPICSVADTYHIVFLPT